MPGLISKTRRLSVGWETFSLWTTDFLNSGSNGGHDLYWKAVKSFKGILHRLHHRKDRDIKDWLAGFGWVHISDGIVRRDSGCKLYRKTCQKPKNSLFMLHQYTSSVTGLLSLTTSWHTQKAGHANCLLQPSQTREDHIENLDRHT